MSDFLSRLRSLDAAAIDAPRPGAVSVGVTGGGSASLGRVVDAPAPAREFTEEERSDLAVALRSAWVNGGPAGMPWLNAADAALAWFKKRGAS